MLAQIKMSDLRREADLARRSTMGLPTRPRRSLRTRLSERVPAFSIRRPVTQGEQLADVLLRVRDDGSSTRAWAVLDYEGDHFEAEGGVADDAAVPVAHLRREVAILEAIDQLRARLTTSLSNQNISLAS